jgi:hypothetical protein
MVVVTSDRTIRPAVVGHLRIARALRAVMLLNRIIARANRISATTTGTLPGFGIKDRSQSAPSVMATKPARTQATRAATARQALPMLPPSSFSRTLSPGLSGS